MADEGGSPGSHGRNWRPAETIEEYLSNCREGLEDYSERRYAKLSGISRMELHRWKLMAEIPDELFEKRLKEAPISTKRSIKMFAAVGQALKQGKRTAEREYCPHCGHLLRIRADFPEEVRAIANDWLSRNSSEDGADGPDHSAPAPLSSSANRVLSNVRGIPQRPLKR